MRGLRTRKFPIAVLASALSICLSISLVAGETTTRDGTALPPKPVSVSVAAVTPADQAVDVQGVVVSATPAPTPWDNWKAKLDHIMPEVSGTEITVTKKATVIKLEQQPPVENNDLQTEFVKAPGLLITEQHTPGQFNFSYRGLGNPQESEFVTVLMDGVPLASDWIGFPTLYFLPLPEAVSEIQMIRGGSSLLYGPEPAPAVNFVTKHPAPGSPWGFYSEQIGGSDGLYSTYNAIQEAHGPIELRADLGYVQSDGQRDNADYSLWQSNLYLGYRPDEKQLWAIDGHISRFDGEDPGRLTLAQFQQDPDQSTTPFNHDWVDRYSVVARHEHEFGDGWLLQAKGWYTHQEIDSRGLPFLVDQDFDNGGGDVRLRKNWGDGTMFKGSTLTFGGTVFHGDAPYTQYLIFDPSLGRDDTPGPTQGFLRLKQSRDSDYQAIFAEDLIRIGKFHIVPSFRLDHESVEVDKEGGTFNALNADADHWVPLWGIGLGNDFGHLNETYFSASTGWRPTRYFDIASPFQTFNPNNQPDPFHSLDFELGVHGTPIPGLWYDLGLFWMEFSNRTETQFLSNSGDFVINNSGDSRHRGFEGELSYDVLARFQPAPAPASENFSDAKTVKDAKDAKDTAVAGATEPYRAWHLTVFSSLQLLGAEFTDSNSFIGHTGRTDEGKTPAFAPDAVWKGGISFSRDHCFDIAFTGVYVGDQFWADADTPARSPVPPHAITTPAKIPSYKVFNLSGGWYITKNVRVIGGISNLFDEKYYSRVFFNGSIEPAPSRSGFGGLSVEF